MTGAHRLTAAAAIAALLLMMAACADWLSLQHGYTISVAVADEHGASRHIAFPAWRKAAHFAECASGLAALLLAARASQAARRVAWPTFAAALLIHAVDIQHYGTLAAPAARTLTALLLVAILASLGDRRWSA